MTRISSFLATNASTSANSSALMSWASSMTRIDFVMRLISTLFSMISLVAAFTMSSDFSRVPLWPRISKQYEWNVLISTYLAALPISSVSLFLNSDAAALEKVSISSFSDFMSSIRISDASFLTRTKVFPLPGPAGTTMNLDSLSEMIFCCVSVSDPNISLYFFGLTFWAISFCLSVSKYFFMKALKSMKK